MVRTRDMKMVVRVTARVIRMVVWVRARVMRMVVMVRTRVMRMVLRIGKGAKDGCEVQARKRIKARDFEYLAKNTRFATIELVEEYFDMVMDKYPDGRMEEEDFIKMFFIAFPARPEEKVHELAKRIANKDGKISMANMPSSSTCSVMGSWKTILLEFSTSLMPMGTRLSP